MPGGPADESQRGIGALTAQFRHRGHLPEGSAADRAKGEETVGLRPVLPDQRPLLRDVETEAQRVGTRQPALKQSAHLAYESSIRG